MGVKLVRNPGRSLSVKAQGSRDVLTVRENGSTNHNFEFFCGKVFLARNLFLFHFSPTDQLETYTRRSPFACPAPA